MTGSRRSYKVMLSSVFRLYEDKRKKIIDLMKLYDLEAIGMDYTGALPTMDTLQSSLDMVNRADALFCLVGHRYGTMQPACKDNPDGLCLTEVEFIRAQTREIPRLNLVMSEKYSNIPIGERISDIEHEALTAFRQRVEKDKVFAEFVSDTDFAEKASQGVANLRIALDNLHAPAAPPAPPQQQRTTSPDEDIPTAPPQFFVVRKPYIKHRPFVGRDDELELIDHWALSTDAMLLFQAIGGMGKSMLTWEWVKTRADAIRSDWAGKVWYSFYEQGADLRDFLIHALAYIRQRPPVEFRNVRTAALGATLRQELDARPWLLVMDGLERVLVAYNRAGKEHMTDEEAEVVKDDLGLDRSPRRCFRPDDDEVLLLLAQADKGKLLVSSRLTPSALTHGMGQPIPGVQHMPLSGLRPADAEQVLRNARVRGDGRKMQRFLQDKFAGHPLSVGVVAGHIAKTFLDARGDFDKWVEDPKGGADPGLVVNGLRGRQNHILEVAFDALDTDQQALLASLSMATIDLTPEIVRLLNPMRPVEPSKMEEPQKLDEEGVFFATNDTEIDEAYDRWRYPSSDNERMEAQKQLSVFADRHFVEQQASYRAYLDESVSWRQAAEHADKWLHRSLPDLEDLGLVQYEPAVGTLDLHPAVRHTAMRRLSTESRTRTGGHVSDALASRPVAPFKDVRDAAELEVVVNRVRALNAAGQLEAGWGLFGSGGVFDPLFRLGCAHTVLEVQQAWFPEGWEGPVLLPEDAQGYAINQASVALSQMGQHEVANRLDLRNLKRAIERNESTSANVYGRNLAIGLANVGQAAEALQLLESITRLAVVAEPEQVGLCGILAMRWHLTGGRLSEFSAGMTALPSEEDRRRWDFQYQAALASYINVAEIRAGTQTEQGAAEHLARVRDCGYSLYEMSCLFDIGCWRQTNNRHEDALDALGDALELANEMRVESIPDLEATRALSLYALGRVEEARRIAEQVSRESRPPHLALAQLWFNLGEIARARDHAIAGYKAAWREGPPYHRHWDLEDCRKVLRALGEPEPSLPAFDPSKIKPLGVEEDIERFIAKIAAEKEAQEIQKLKAQEKAASETPEAEPKGDDTTEQD